MNPPSRQRTAVLLDPYLLWQEAVAQVLLRIGVEVEAKTTSPEHALAIVEERKPDLLVTEVELDGSSMDGIECLRQAKELVPGLRAIVLSLYHDPERIEAAFAAGAAAYVVKTAHPDDLASAVRQAFENSVYLPGARELPLNGDAGVAGPPPLRVVDESPGLTRRELEILRLVAEGHSNAELARMLWVTEQTVKFHLSKIYRKLGVSNRTEASRWAQVNNLLPMNVASRNGE